MDMGVGIMFFGQVLQILVLVLFYFFFKVFNFDNIFIVFNGIIDEDFLFLFNIFNGVDVMGGGIVLVGVINVLVVFFLSLGKFSLEGKLVERRRLSVESMVLKCKVSLIFFLSVLSIVCVNGSLNGNDDVIVEEEDGNNVEEGEQVNFIEYIVEYQNCEEDGEKVDVG